MNNITKIISLSLASMMLTMSVSAEVNKYNEMDYVNNTNRTIGEIAEEKQISLEDFKMMYKLPDDMAANTNEAVAFYSMTVENVAAMYGVTTDELIAELKGAIVTDAVVDKDTLWGDANYGISIKNHIGDISFEEFKTVYELDENITENSTLGEIRNRVARKQLELAGLLTYFKSDDLLVMADGRYLDFDVAPSIINDRTMVPMRNIFEYFNAEVAWDGETKTILAKSGENLITMQIGQNFFFLNDQKIELDSPSVIVNDRTLVPVRAISEALQREVAYNANTRTVIIH